VKLLETKDQLLEWEEYRAYLKLNLKRITREQGFFVSKDPLEFQINGKPWRGYAVLAGPKSDQCVRKLKQDGIRFQTGTCSRQGREIKIGAGDLKDKHLREAEKTFLKLRLGYKLLREGEEPTAPAE